MTQPRKVFRWLWNICVVGVMACCLWGLVQDTRKLTPLKAEVARLEKLVGHVEVHDVSQIQVLNIKSDSPDELFWRVILPAGHTWTLSHQIAGGGGGSATWSSKDQQDMFVRARFVKQEGKWNWLIMHDSGSGTNGVNQSTGDFVTSHWHELDIELAAQSNQITRPVTKVVSLLKVTVPESIFSTVKEDLGDYVHKRLPNEPLLLIEIGMSAAFAAKKQNAVAE